MRLAFFLGKGGVGKSTCSSALAYQLATKGEKTLLASFDPAHNLGDIFGLRLSGKIKGFCPHLDLLEIDLQKATENYIAKTKELIKQVYSYNTAYNADGYFNLFRYLPGIQEYASITALLDLVQEQKGNYDNIIFDTPPTGLALRVLALPMISIKWLMQLKSLREKILDKRHTIASINDRENKLRCQQAMKTDKVLSKICRMLRGYQEFDDLLKSNEVKCGIVVNPDFLSLRESVRIKDGLREIGIKSKFLVINKITNETRDAVKEAKKSLSDDNTIDIEICCNSDSYKLSDDLTKIF